MANRVIPAFFALALLAGAAAAPGQLVVTADVAPGAPSAHLGGARQDREWIRDTPRRVDLVMDYRKGVAYENFFSTDGAQLGPKKIAQTPPAPSPEEIEEAFGMVRADPDLSRLFARFHPVLEGGFVLEEGRGKPCGPGSPMPARLPALVGSGRSDRTGRRRPGAPEDRLPQLRAADPEDRPMTRRLLALLAFAAAGLAAPLGAAVADLQPERASTSCRGRPAPRCGRSAGSAPRRVTGTNGSGLEIRNVYFNGHLVLKRAHVPMLNVDYDPGGCGCYRDWQNQEVVFHANNPIPGIPGYAEPTVPPTTVCDVGGSAGDCGPPDTDCFAAWRRRSSRTG